MLSFIHIVRMGTMVKFTVEMIRVGQGLKLFLKSEVTDYLDMHHIMLTSRMSLLSGNGNTEIISFVAKPFDNALLMSLWLTFMVWHPYGYREYLAC